MAEIINSPKGVSDDDSRPSRVSVGLAEISIQSMR